jgi:tetratricopeptide (TPR) repeat protein
MADQIERESLVSLLHAAHIAGRLDYARELATEWLMAWPGDSEVWIQLARIELEAGLSEPATKRMSRLIEIDPESPEAYALLAKAYRQSGDMLRPPIYEACYQVLTSGRPDAEKSPAWAVSVARAYSSLDEGDVAEALRASKEALTADPSLALPTVVAMKSQLAAGNAAEASQLAQIGHDRWPECLAFSLIEALARLELGKSAEAVERLHQLASADPLGLIAESVMGVDHPYRQLWPSRMVAKLSRPIPSEVSSVMGSNHLSARTGSKQPARLTRSAPRPEAWEAFQGPDSGQRAPTTAAEVLIQVRNEFDRLAQRLNARRPSFEKEARQPVYVVLSSHTRLVQQFGESTFRRIDEATLDLVNTIRRKRGWGAYRFYVDNPRTLKPFGLVPSDPGNAWQIKLKLADLDQALGERGEMIGAVLIVGGPKIVPFHLLPNPTDDDDDHVPSDNPYATTDENYFAPEWPIGRLPSDADPELIIKMLRTAAATHRQELRSLSRIANFGVWIRDRFGRFFRPRPRAIGLTASIWRKASLAVFRAIGAPRSLVTSPPATASGVVSRPSGFSYFNLHGLEDAPEWFGQRDPVRDKPTDDEFPVALRPQDIVNSGRAPKIVFTEACYGAHVIDKDLETALSLKFLGNGSHAVIGSTKISYGSITPPLIAADLLGWLFWDQLSHRLPVGEALRRAKLRLVSEMHERQGFLDGEDQKTLISFVLYGDPLFAPRQLGIAASPKSIARTLTRPNSMKTACALGGPDLIEQDPDSATAERVRSIVAKYLPGMADASCSLRSQHEGCSHEDHCCPSQQVGMKTVGNDDVMVVTLSKKVMDGKNLHPHYARVTLDHSGKVTKLAVSR